MKLGIMQPYFFPYIGYISLIKHTDRFILLDDVQYIRHGWIERNRILKQNEGWLYISVPLIKNSSKSLIKDRLINNKQNWQDKIKAQLQIYRKVAPYYKEVMQIIDEVFNKEYSDITSLNKRSLEITCSYLGFPKEVEIFSEMNLQIDEPKEADEWALNICKRIKTKEYQIHYINPIGGLEFFDRNKYKKNGVDISFQKIELTDYFQKRDMFEPGLSIIDVMMFNSVQEVNVMLDNYELV